MKIYNNQPENPLMPALVDLLAQIRKERNFNPNVYMAQKVEILNKYLTDSGLNTCVVAVSGGIDSAVVLGLVKLASMKANSPIKRIVPLLLPIFDSSGVTNQKEATAKGIELCESLELVPYIVDLGAINTQVRSSLESVLGITGDDWAIGQLGPYTRTSTMYYTTSLLTQEGFKALICGTTNKDEGGYLGYFGKASDGMVDIQLISDIHKSEVYEVAEELGIPQSIVEAVPTGDMYDSRDDETVFGAPYDFVEIYLYLLKISDYERSEILDGMEYEARDQFEGMRKNLDNMHRYNKHKYLGASPAVHLDVIESRFDGGWDYNTY